MLFSRPFFFYHTIIIIVISNNMALMLVGRFSGNAAISSGKLCDYPLTFLPCSSFIEFLYSISVNLFYALLY